MTSSRTDRGRRCSYCTLHLASIGVRTTRKTRKRESGQSNRAQTYPSAAGAPHIRKINAVGSVVNRGLKSTTFAFLVKCQKHHLSLPFTPHASLMGDFGQWWVGMAENARPETCGGQGRARATLLPRPHSLLYSCFF